MKSARIVDVARLAGVAPSTVSKVLNQSAEYDRISEPTRQRVIDAARQLRYQPHAAGRSLASRRSRVAGLVVFDPIYLDEQPFASILAAACQRLSWHGFGLMILASDPSRGEEFAGIHYTAHAFNRSVEGLIIHDQRLPMEAFLELNNHEVPFVAMDCLVPGLERRCLLFDYEGAIHRAIGSLIRQGFSNFIHLYHDAGREVTARQRTIFRQTIEEAGQGITGREFELVGSGSQGLDEAVQYLAAHERTGVLFTAANHHLNPVFDAIRSAGFRFAADVAVVAIGGTDLQYLAEPAVDVLSFSFREAGARAADLLLRQIEHEEADEAPAPVALVYVRGATTPAPLDLAGWGRTTGDN